MASQGGDNAQREREACEWIETVTGQSKQGSTFEWLRDGVVLCELANAIKPNTCKKYKKSQTAFVCRTNIEIYGKGCRALGVPNGDCFESRDLYDGQNMVAVINNVFSLSAAARNVAGFNGPFIGVAYAQENKRNFSAEVLAKSKSAVPAWNRGDNTHDLSSQHDSYGIVRNQNVTKHSGGMGVWDKGAIQHSTGAAHDGRGIVRSAELAHHTGAQSKWEQGAIQNDLSSQHDSYGIVRNPNVTKHTGVQSKWETGAIANDNSSMHDSAGIIKDMNNQQRGGRQ